MKKAAALFISVGLLVGALWFSRPASPPAATGNGGSPDAPDAPLYAMLAAAREGDVEAYLTCFSGDLRRRLEQTIGEVGRDKFADYLKRAHRDIKAMVVYGAPAEAAAADTMALTVEFVYADRNETQTHRLTKVRGAWKISGADGAQRIRTLIPYGTQVFPAERSGKGSGE